jgi:single-stranded DNA-binding protein
VLRGNPGHDASSAPVNGDAIVDFRMAMEHSSRPADGSYMRAVNGHTVKVWNAESRNQFLKKGTKVHVQE